MDINAIVDSYRARSDCRVYPPSGLPVVEPGNVLPDDLQRFYELCGGMELFIGEAFAITIVPPQKLVPANPVIYILPNGENIVDYIEPDDESWSWYIIGEGEPNLGGWWVTIDLSLERLGHCYDSFWDVHPWNSKTIAKSFTDLLLLLFPYKGDYWYRSEEGFKSLPDAYPNP